jgi:hypothetical protein
MTAWVFLITITLYIGLVFYYKLGWKDIVLTSFVLAVLYYFYMCITMYDIYFRRLCQLKGVDPHLFDGVDGYKYDLNKYRHLKESNGYSFTYGEIFTAGVRNIYDLGFEMGMTDVFIDMGSGVGKAIICAKLMGFKHCIGVELIEERCQATKAVIEKLPYEQRKYIDIHCADMFDFDLTQFDIPIVIFASNLVWSDETTIKFFQHIASNCVTGTIVIASLLPSVNINNTWRLVKKIKTPMSWDWSSSSFVVQKN